MKRLSSTLEVAMTCYRCGKWLKETEVYYLGIECTECNWRDIQQQNKGE